jgi:hypothetical protein
MVIASKWSTEVVLGNLPWPGAVSIELGKMMNMCEAWWNFRYFSFGLPSPHTPSHISCRIAEVASRNFNWTLRNADSSRCSVITCTASSSHYEPSLEILSPWTVSSHSLHHTHIFSSWHWYNRSHWFHNNNSIQFFIIYVPSQQPQGQL